MSINTHEIYITCPDCGFVDVRYDHHENTSSEREEEFCILNQRDNSIHTCPQCGKETEYKDLFTPQYCKVENLQRYKNLLTRRIHWAERNGHVSFSDWDYNGTYGEEPALSRLIKMYPEDSDLVKIKTAYSRLRMFGKKAVTKYETNNKTVSRENILLPGALEKIYLGNYVKRIEDYTFSGCEFLEDAFIPDSVIYIGEYAFANSGLHKVHMSGKIESIGKGAFANTKFSRFFFPESLKSIGERCFAKCYYLNNLWIPEKMQIGKDAFAECPNLKHIQVHKSVTDEELHFWGISEDCEVERYDS